MVLAVLLVGLVVLVESLLLSDELLVGFVDPGSWKMYRDVMKTHFDVMKARLDVMGMYLGVMRMDWEDTMRETCTSKNMLIIT